MISVIIPTVNEAQELGPTLAAVAANATPHETLVVDAQSEDGTADLAVATGARVVISPRRQRAAQMNLGAGQARGACLLFLHADTHLAPGALAAITEVLQNPNVLGGAFRRRFASSSRWLRLTCRLSDWRGRRLGWFLGDQAIFVRCENFAALGGFSDFDAFEDLDFSRRLLRLGRVVLLDPPVVSSARRFAQRGPCLTTLHDVWLTLRYLSGANPRALAGRR